VTVEQHTRAIAVPTGPPRDRAGAGIRALRCRWRAVPAVLVLPHADPDWSKWIPFLLRRADLHREQYV